jgi:FxsC-like protein
MDEHVWKDDALPDQYERLGLRDLRFVKPNAYKKAIVALGQSIVNVWRGHKERSLNGLGAVLDFEHVPNAFGEDEWQEAANGDGWIHGPTVVNVIYGAGTKRTVTLRNSIPKYGDCAREWKPYLPPCGQTIGDLTKTAIHDQCLRYREIPINGDLSEELELARGRKNLLVVVADPSSLTQAPNQILSAYDRLPPEGTAVLLPWDDQQEDQWQSHNIQNAIDQIFPAKSRTQACYHAPILTVDDMRSTLSTTLVEIRDSLTKVETNRKPISDVGPPVVSGAAAL